MDDTFADVSRSWHNRQLLITQRLRHRRADLQLTQKQVVTRLARLGVRTTNRALSSLEHGAGIDIAKLPELALALDCTVTYLIGLTDEPHQWEPDAVSSGDTAALAGPAAVVTSHGAQQHIAQHTRVPTHHPRATAHSAPPREPSQPRESLILGAGFPEHGPWPAADDH